MTIDQVKQIILVLSGKGGVGKSSVTAQLALASLYRGLRVGILDIDLCGPSIPRIFNCMDSKIIQTASGWMPIQVGEGKVGDETGGAASLSLMSIGFLLPNQDDAVVWRGPKKTAMINQFLQQVSWTPLDVLFIDTPPGTSDEHLSILEALNNYPNKQAILVTTPQIISLMDVERELLFCNALALSISGIIENMSGFKCEGCGQCTNVFSKGGGSALARKYGVPFLGELPIVPQVAEMFEREDGDVVAEYKESELYPLINQILDRLLISRRGPLVR